MTSVLTTTLLCSITGDLALARGWLQEAKASHCHLLITLPAQGALEDMCSTEPVLPFLCLQEDQHPASPAQSPGNL